MADIQKNKREILRVEKSTFKGAEYAQIRVWYLDADGEYRPTQKGVSFKPELLPDLIGALRELTE